MKNHQNAATRLLEYVTMQANIVELLNAQDWEGLLRECSGLAPKKINIRSVDPEKMYSLLMREGSRIKSIGRIRILPVVYALCIHYKSDRAEAWLNLAVSLRWLNDTPGALRYIEKSLAISSSSSNAWNTYGCLLLQQGKLNDALQAFNRSIRLDPKNPYAYSNRSDIHNKQKDLDSAYIDSKKAIELDPNNPENLLIHFSRSCWICDFSHISLEECLRLANRVNPGHIHSFMLNLLTRCETAEDSKSILAFQRKWAGSLNTSGSSRVVKAYQSDRHNRRIKIGILSGDLRNHSVARFIRPLFNEGQSGLEIYCYSLRRSMDDQQIFFREKSHKFCDVINMSDKSLSYTIATDNLDILIDLCGFTGSSRLSALAHRSAPIQMSWLGYPGTTGLKEIDYLFVDRYLRPASNDLVSERLLITEGSSICFGRGEEVKISEDLPSERNGFIVFGSLNNPYKITRKTVALWVKAMKANPMSHLLLVRAEYESLMLRNNLLKEFAVQGISPKRIVFANNHRSSRHYLDCYNDIDISLDTFPLTGGTTTTDALWMGVPVVSLVGCNIHQRISYSILSHAGLQDLTSETEEGYVEIVSRLAADLTRRKYLRSHLRKTLINSALCNERSFVDNFVDAMRRAIGEEAYQAKDKT